MLKPDQFCHKTMKQRHKTDDNLRKEGVNIHY